MTSADHAQIANHPFRVTANPGQRPPDGAWRSWLFMGGRGAGKTRAGAEWVRWQVLEGGCRRVALVGPTLSDVREVMVEGPSGLLSLAWQPGEAPKWESTRRRLSWPNGAEAFGFSAEDADSLRGPQFDAAWCDEIAAWADGEAVWDMLQMGLRLGPDPRVVATTTPRPVKLVKRLVAAKDGVVTRAGMEANAANLSPGFVETMRLAYAGTHLGRQELDGELIEDLPGALWSRALIERARVTATGPFERVVVGVDPPAGAGPSSDACGIVVVGLDSDSRAVVIRDDSVRGLAPSGWAARVAGCVEVTGASEVVAEANQGGEMVREVLEAAGCGLPVRLVHAKVGKTGRAMPVAALYERGQVVHAGAFAALEDEMCSFGAGSGRSPDRVDALVWAVWALKLERRGMPRVRGV